MTASCPNNLFQWSPAITSLFLARPDFSVMDVLSVSQRNLVLLIKNSNQEESIIKVSKKGGLEKEVECLIEVKHPNIVSLLDAWYVGDYVFVQFEKVPGKCLVTWLVEEGKLPETLCQKIFKQIVSALNFLHTKGWVHRDIKPDNIIYDRHVFICPPPSTASRSSHFRCSYEQDSHSISGSIKLIDFEFSSRFEKGSRFEDCVGTKRYMSPQVCHRKYDGRLAEVWSLGVTLYTMLTGHFPFTDSDLFLQLRNPLEQEVSGEFAFGSNNQTWRLHEPDYSRVSEEAKSLLKGMLQVDERKRMTLEQVEYHEWVQGRHSLTMLREMTPKKEINIPQKSQKVKHLMEHIHNLAEFWKQRILSVPSLPSSHQATNHETTREEEKRNNDEKEKGDDHHLQHCHYLENNQPNHQPLHRFENENPIKKDFQFQRAEGIEVSMSN